MDVAITFVPLLVVELLEVVVSRVDGEGSSHQRCQFQLLVGLIEQYVVFLVDDPVTITAVAGEDEETKFTWASTLCARWPSRRCLRSGIRARTCVPCGCPPQSLALRNL